MIPESSYEAWIKPIKAVTKYDYENDDIHLIPELIKPVTLTVPAWVNASTDNKCPSCGWPVYHYNVESTIFYYCTNPECYHIPIYSRIVDGLKHRDQMKRERHDWNRVKKAEPEGFGAGCL